MTETIILKSKLRDLPQKPGVYKFLGKRGEVLYIGKAKNLKNRVNQYFSGHDTREQIPYLLAEVADVDYTVVNNELESLYLENTQIKQYLPRYNIMLRDDKNYAFIKIDYATEIPQIVIARKIEPEAKYEIRISKSEINPKSLNSITESSDLKFHPVHPKPRYFGPYSAAYKIRNTLHLVRRIFPYCSAQKVSSRPCFYYYLHRCPGVCVGKISLAEYRLQLDRICNFLSGNAGRIKKDLAADMKAASQRQEFERAARLRDQLQALEVLDERQSVILSRKVDWDIVSCSAGFGYACINLFKVRNGKLADKENFIYEIKKSIGNTPDNVVQTFLEQYYLEASSAPREIFIQDPIESGSAVVELLQARFSKRIKISCPQRGKTKELLELGQTNAGEFLRNWLQSQAGHLDHIHTALEQLQQVLRLPEIPNRIECFDISNIQGTNAVGSMVVFEKGLPKKSEYRKFRIKTSPPSGGPDDFAMMREMLTRRMQRMGTKDAESEASDTAAWPIPDLIVIDGGKGQLSAALEVLQATAFPLPPIPVIGLAKRIEEIFLPDKPQPIVLGHGEPGLQLLQRLRDEAHRFGITYHRALRSKQAVKSALDDIAGIGPKTKKLLKQKFGTVASIRKTSTEELSKIVGENLAKIIKEKL